LEASVHADRVGCEGQAIGAALVTRVGARQQVQQSELLFGAALELLAQNLGDVAGGCGRRWQGKGWL